MAAPTLRRAVLGTLLSLLIVPPAAGAAEPGITPLGFTVGGRTVDEGPAIAGALSRAPQGHKWVRVFHDWKQGEPSDDVYDPGVIDTLNRRLAAFQAAGAKVIVTVQTPPSWAPSVNTDAGAAKYAEFMAFMARTYAGRVAVWELWNEPDGDTFWPKGPQPASYANLLKRTYPAIKAVDPSAIVITGGMVGNNYDFLEKVYVAGGGGSFDGVAVHTDTACRVDSPDVAYRENGRIGRFAFTGYREVYATMADHGDASKGIWMTEIGWNDAADLDCDEGANKGKRKKGVDQPTQAAFLKQAYACIAADPYVKVASWFTLQDHIPTSRFGLFDYNGNERLAHDALQQVGDGTGAGIDRSCGAKVDRDKPTVKIAAPATYFHRFTTTGAAVDGTTAVKRIELWADGRKVLGQNGATFRYDWFGSSKLSYGDHTVELRAYDEADNVGTASAVVTRLGKNAPRTVTAALELKVRRSGRRFRVTATVKPPTDGSFAEPPRGRLELRFEHRRGRGWKRSRVRKGIGDGGVHHTYRARKPGRWRVYAVLVADAPYKRTKTRTFKFRVR